MTSRIVYQLSTRCDKVQLSAAKLVVPICIKSKQVDPESCLLQLWNLSSCSSKWDFNFHNRHRGRNIS